ncbi:unnamed protein product [Effrenium voratum]|nr:unnamed protein product [Effrenium voratum]
MASMSKQSKNLTGKRRSKNTLARNGRLSSGARWTTSMGPTASAREQAAPRITRKSGRSTSGARRRRSKRLSASAKRATKPTESTTMVLLQFITAGLCCTLTTHLQRQRSWSARWMR